MKYKTNASQVDRLLSQSSRKIDRVKASFSIEKRLFEGFRTICEEKNISQSDLLDALMADLLAKHSALPRAGLPLD